MRRFFHPDEAPDGAPAPLSWSGALPLELDSFFGRSEESAALAGMLERARLVTVTGAGGVGKSRLTLRAAASARSRFPGGARLVELSSVRDPALVEYAVADAAGLLDQTLRPPREALLDHLTGQSTLLLLDGYEHVLEECAALVRDLLRRVPGLVVLAAGRRPLTVAGERVLHLAPLPVADAAALLADRAAACLPGFALHEGNRATVHHLCERLDRLPLAVELAAGRLRALSPAQLLARLDDGFDLLTGGTPRTPERHRSLHTAVGFSHELCSPRERLLWARLTVFAGPFELEAAEYICGGDELPAESILDVLDELLAQSVVSREETPTGVRYRMLDTVRAYGARWLTAVGDATRMRRRHRDWYTGLATWCELDWFSPRQAEVAARLESELADVRAALEYSLTEPGEERLGQYLAGTLWFYWVGCGRLAEGRHWLERGVELTDGHAESRLKCLWVLGYVAVLQGDTVGALRALQECADEAERVGSATAAAYAEHRTGCVALLNDDPEHAEELLSSALESYRRLGELNSNVLMGQVELAMALAFQGELDEAVRLCEEVREVCEDHGELWALAYALYVLGFAAWTRGDLTEARALVQRCLALDHAFHDLLGSVLAMELLALFVVSEGDAVEAAVLQGAAGRMWGSVGLPLFGSANFGAPHRACETRARAALGTARYEEAVREGALLAPNVAVTRALTLAGAPAGPSEDGAEETRDTREPAASRPVRGGEAAG
ncbi:ATP-binding protein [Streptomyces tsukubensis]|uniref:Regulator n=1 Tax=Streptomyces tsukubensis TaxID=83656 RepID=A0A1V4ADR4_9ACTN|nr:tetratricopeptide repeat protein [Streptomyces tsukubensis]OON82115.1 regulator [Streptomyces tsukubensis]QFR92598.1 tetratricopeptide repeat protein [Streptomyces tsukubensis]